MQNEILKNAPRTATHYTYCEWSGVTYFRKNKRKWEYFDDDEKWKMAPSQPTPYLIGKYFKRIPK